MSSSIYGPFQSFSAECLAVHNLQTCYTCQVYSSPPLDLTLTCSYRIFVRHNWITFLFMTMALACLTPHNMKQNVISRSNISPSIKHTSVLGIKTELGSIRRLNLPVSIRMSRKHWACGIASVVGETEVVFQVDDSLQQESLVWAFQLCFSFSLGH